MVSKVQVSPNVGDVRAAILTMAAADALGRDSSFLRKENKDQALADTSSVCRGGGLVTGIDPGAALRTLKSLIKKSMALSGFPVAG